MGRGQHKVVLDDEPLSRGRSNLWGLVHEWARVSQEPDKLGGRKMGYHPKQFKGSWDKAIATESER